MHMAGQRMKTEKIMCEVCGNGCEMEVEIEDGEVQDVSGNGCMKGFIFAQQKFREMEEN